MAGSFQDELDIFVKLNDQASAQLKVIAQNLAGVNAASKQAAAGMAAAGAVGNTAAAGISNIGIASAGSTREILVLAHEMISGNFSRIPGSLIVLGERTNILHTALEALSGVGVAGGIALGALAAAAGAVGLAFYQNAQDVKAFNNTLLLTNNYLGLSADGMRSFGEVAGLSLRATTEEAEALAKMGVFSQEQIGLILPLITNLKNAGAGDFDDLNKRFALFAEQPGKAAAEFNKAAHIFSAAQLEQIESLEKSGNKAEALRIIFTALSIQQDEYSKTVESNIGTFQRWGIEISDVYEKFKLFTGLSTKPLEQQIADLGDRIAEMKKKGETGGGLVTTDDFGHVIDDGQSLNELQTQYDALTSKQIERQKGLQDKAFKAQQQTLGNQALSYFQSLGIKGGDSLQAALDEFTRKVRDLRVANPTSKYLSDDFLRQAEDQIRKANVNPIDDTVARQRYQASLKDLDGYIQASAEKYKLKNALIKAGLTSGDLDQEEADSLLQESRQQELKDQEAFVQQKIALADKEIARTSRRDGVEQRAAAVAELKKLQDEELINDADYAANLAANQRIISQINQKLIDDTNKQAAARETAVNRENNKATLNSNDASLADAQNSVNDRFDALTASTTAQLKARHASEQDELAALKTVEDARSDALSKEKDYYNQRIALQQDANVGFKKGFADYQQAAQDTAQHAQDFFKSATDGFASFIETFAETGKLNFKSLEESITSSISKIVAQILIAKAEAAFANSDSGSSLAGLFGAGLSALFGGARATGGPVSPGKFYQVNERGPELFAPDTAGTIIPNSALGGTTQHFAVTILTNDQQSFKSSANAISRDLAKMVNEANRRYNLPGAR